MAEGGASRRYDSPARRTSAARSRERIIAAASSLFTERGWSGTSIREVARVAGVSVETVYNSVGGKVDLLSTALDVAVVGDDEPVPLRERPEFLAFAHGTRAERFAAVATFLKLGHARVAPIYRALTEAAYADPTAAALRDRDLANQRADTRRALTLLLGRTPTPIEVDETLVIAGTETFDFLTAIAGWSGDEYAQWLAGALARFYPEGET